MTQTDTLDPLTVLEWKEIAPEVTLPPMMIGPVALERGLVLLRWFMRKLAAMNEAWAPFDQDAHAESTLAVADLFIVGLIRIATAEAGGGTFVLIRPSELAERLYPATVAKGVTHERTDGFDFFAVWRRFWDEKWPSCLTPTESLVWLAMLRNTDGDGEAWPGSKRIAEMLGHKRPEDVRRTRGSLCRRGMLVAIENTGRNGTPLYRVTLPPCVEKAHTVPCVGKAHAGSVEKAHTGVCFSHTPPVCEKHTQTTHRNTEGNNPKKGEPPVDVSGASPVPQDWLASWQKWLAYCRDKGIKKSAAQRDEEIQKLTAITPAQAEQAIGNAITSGWKTFYTDRITKGRNAKREFTEPKSIGDLIPTL